MLYPKLITVIILYIKDVSHSQFINIYTFVYVLLLISLYVENSSIGQFSLRFSVIPGIFRSVTHIT